MLTYIMKKLHQHLPVILLLWVLAAAGCSTTSQVTSSAGSANPNADGKVYSVPAGTAVWLLAPRVSFEDARTGLKLDPAFHGGAALATALTENATTTLKSRGLPDVISLTDGSVSTSQKTAADQASSTANRLARALPDSETALCLRELASTNRPTAALVQYVRAKIGPSGTWDPNTGAITSDPSSTQIRAALVDCQSGACLWENSVLLRKRADAAGSDLAKALNVLFANLNPPAIQKP